MAAFCPVCQFAMYHIEDICPHVAVIENNDEALIFVGGSQVVTIDWDSRDRADLDVLTYIGDIEGVGSAYFSPNPAIYAEAIKQNAITGVPTGDIYVAMFRALGLEHENWHEGKDG